MYLIGKITSTHGIKGEVKVTNRSDFERFFIGNTVYYLSNGDLIPLVIKAVRPHKNQLLIYFDSFNSINEVLFLKGMDLYAKERMETSDYYYDQLLGLDVLLKDGSFVGKVVGIREVPQGHILEVKNKRTFLLPFCKEFVNEVTKDTIIITPIDGLICE